VSGAQLLRGSGRPGRPPSLRWPAAGRARGAGQRRWACGCALRTIPAGAEGFGFDDGALGTFTLDDDGEQVFTELEAGAYTVTETDAGALEFSNVECIAADWSADGPSVTVNLGEGEVAVCTSYNGELPYTGAEGYMTLLLVAGLASVLAGLGLVVAATMRRSHGRA